KKEWYVIVKPPFEISTKNAYAYLRLTKTRKTDKIKKCVNRLEDVVIP
ncbi:MAG: hypothetical protein COS68_05495, partial [Elusimicrobia bacterium CG06_land_8_20_14_3_00_38_11]